MRIKPLSNEPDQTLHRKFHIATSPSKGAQLPVEEWPESWRKISYKGYPRFTKILLPDIPASEGDAPSLLTVMRSRRSRSPRANQRPLTLMDLSWLFNGIGPTGKGVLPEQDLSRAYPSAGARYPIEAYVLVLNCEELSPGAYHYHVRSHSLEHLWSTEGSKVEESFTQIGLNIGQASCIIVLTAVVSRSIPKYGEMAYRFALLEAGHAAQNICLLAEARRRSCLPLGGNFDSVAVSDMLDVDAQDTGRELVLYSLVVG